MTHAAGRARPDEVDHMLIVAGKRTTDAIRHCACTGRLRLRLTVMYRQVTDGGAEITDPIVVPSQLSWPRRRRRARQLDLPPPHQPSEQPRGPDGHGVMVTAAFTSG